MPYFRCIIGFGAELVSRRRQSPMDIIDHRSGIIVEVERSETLVNFADFGDVFECSDFEIAVVVDALARFPGIAFPARSTLYNINAVVGVTCSPRAADHRPSVSVLKNIGVFKNRR